MNLRQMMKILTAWGNEVVIPHAEALLKDIPAHYALIEKIESYFLSQTIMGSNEIMRNRHLINLAKELKLNVTDPAAIFNAQIVGKAETSGKAEIPSQASIQYTPDIPILTIQQVSTMRDLQLIRQLNTCNCLDEPYGRNPNEYPLNDIVEYVKKIYPYMPLPGASTTAVPSEHDQFYYYYFLTCTTSHLNGSIIRPSIQLLIYFFNFVTEFVADFKAGFTENDPDYKNFDTMYNLLDLRVNIDASSKNKTSIKGVFPGVYDQNSKASIGIEALIYNIDPIHQKYPFFDILKNIFTTPWEALFAKNPKQTSSMLNAYHDFIEISSKFFQTVNKCKKFYSEYKKLASPAPQVVKPTSNHTLTTHTGDQFIYEIYSEVAGVIKKDMANVIGLTTKIKTQVLDHHSEFVNSKISFEFIKEVLLTLFSTPISSEIKDSLNSLKSDFLLHFFNHETFALPTEGKPISLNELLQYSDVKFLKLRTSSAAKKSNNPSTSKDFAYFVEMLKETINFQDKTKKKVIKSPSLYQFYILEKYFSLLHNFAILVYKFSLFYKFLATELKSFLDSLNTDASIEDVENIIENLVIFNKVLDSQVDALKPILNEEDMAIFQAKIAYLGNKEQLLQQLKEYITELKKEFSLYQQTVEKSLMELSNDALTKQPKDINENFLKFIFKLHDLLNKYNEIFIKKSPIYIDKILENFKFFPELADVKELIQELHSGLFFNKKLAGTNLSHCKITSFTADEHKGDIILKAGDRNKIFNFSPSIFKKLLRYTTTTFPEQYERPRAQSGGNSKLPKTNVQRLRGSSIDGSFWRNLLTKPVQNVPSPSPSKDLEEKDQDEEFISHNLIAIHSILAQNKIITLETKASNFASAENDEVKFDNNANEITTNSLHIHFPDIKKDNQDQIMQITKYLMPYIEYQTSKTFSMSQEGGILIKNYVLKKDHDTFQFVIILGNELAPITIKNFHQFLEDTLNYNNLTNSNGFSNMKF